MDIAQALDSGGKATNVWAPRRKNATVSHLAEDA